MVAKISHGMNLYGALAYNHDKVAAGTAEILSGSRMISDRLGLPSEDMRLALLSFENYLLANRNTEKPVLHISLSPAPEDRLSHTQLEELADRVSELLSRRDLLSNWSAIQTTTLVRVSQAESSSYILRRVQRSLLMRIS